MSYEKLRPALGRPVARCIQAYDVPMVVLCDGRCDKAWGMNGGRPKIQLDPDNEDDYCYLSDDEVGEAPEDPGTCEGECGKPRTPEERHNKWCFRECERSSFAEQHEPSITTKDWSRRVFNIPQKLEAV